MTSNPFRFRSEGVFCFTPLYFIPSFSAICFTSDLENKVHRIKDRFELEEKKVSAELIKKVLLGSDNLGAPNKRLVGYFVKFIERPERMSEQEEDTIKVYSASLHNCLKNFLTF